jgi:hypothetical protein
VERLAKPCGPILPHTHASLARCTRRAQPRPRINASCAGFPSRPLLDAKGQDWRRPLAAVKPPGAPEARTFALCGADATEPAPLQRPAAEGGKYGTGAGRAASMPHVICCICDAPKAPSALLNHAARIQHGVHHTQDVVSWINAARTARLGLLAISAVLFASWARILPLNAQSVDGAQLHGCWKQDERWKQDELRGSEKWIAFSVICFSADQTTYHYSVSPFRGMEQPLEWRLADRDLLVIDSQSCDADLRGLPGTKPPEALWLSRCLYAGAWVRQCTLMNEGGKGCAEWVKPHALLDHRLHGCWRQDSPNGGSVQLCFKGDQSVDRISILRDGDGFDGVSDLDRLALRSARPARY